MNVEDLRPQGAGWRLRLHEKGGKHHEMPCHHALAQALHACLANGGALEHAQEMAAHESPRTTKLYDRTKERLTQQEVARIRPRFCYVLLFRYGY
jgi:hypothetical protein